MGSKQFWRHMNLCPYFIGLKLWGLLTRDLKCDVRKNLTPKWNVMQCSGLKGCKLNIYTSIPELELKLSWPTFSICKIVYSYYIECNCCFLVENKKKRYVLSITYKFYPNSEKNRTFICKNVKFNQLEDTKNCKADQVTSY